MKNLTKFCLVFLTTVQIFGSGYWLPIMGPRSTARGGAFITKADDLTATIQNPAGLSRIKDGQAYLSIGGINTRGSIHYYNRPFENEQEYDPTDYSYEILNQPDPFFNPTIAVSERFGLKKWNFSFALHGPYAPDYKYDSKCRGRNHPTCPNRYSLYDSDIVMANAQLTASYNILPNLAVGVGLKNSYVNFRYNLDFIVAGGELGSIMNDYVREGGGDANIEFDVSDPINFNFNIGVIYDLTPKIGFSFAYQSPIDVEADGTADVNIYDRSDILINARTEIIGDDISVSLKLPHTFKIGFLYQELGFFNVELVLGYEMWSRHDEIVISPKMSAKTGLGDGTLTMDDMVQPKEWKDTFSIHLGGDIIFLNETFILSLGTFFEQGAIPDTYYDASIIDSDKYGVSVGIEYKWNYLQFTSAFSYINFVQRDVITSKAHPANPLENDFPSDFIVGNGRYKTDMFIFSVGVAINF